MKTETEIQAKRIQRKRTKGYKMPPGAVYVGRPTKWGNPFRLTPDGWIECYSINRNILNPWIIWSISGGFSLIDILQLYELWVVGMMAEKLFLPKPPSNQMFETLRGHDLFCWCPLDRPCHADILLKLANQPEL